MIRRAVAADYEDMCALFAEADALHAEHVPWLFRTPPAEPRSREHISGLLNDANSSLFVAQAQDLVGVARVQIRDAPDFGVFIPQRWGVLDSIAVTSAWKRRGIGRALTHESEQWARAQGAAWLELQVYDFNEGARAFYEALGYLPASTKLRKPLQR